MGLDLRIVTLSRTVLASTINSKWIVQKNKTLHSLAE